MMKHAICNKNLKPAFEECSIYLFKHFSYSFHLKKELRGLLVDQSLSGSFPRSLLMRWPKCWSLSFRICPSSEHSGLISFRTDRYVLLAVQGLSRPSSSTTLNFLLWLPVLKVHKSLPYCRIQNTQYGNRAYLQQSKDIKTVDVQRRLTSLE